MSETRLAVGTTLRRALGLFREEWRILIALAVLVEIPVVIADTTGAVLLDVDVDATVAIEAAAAVLFLFTWSAVAHHLLLAAVERVEAARRHGHDRVGLTTILRGFPIGRLLAADVLVTLVTIVGLVLLVVPGIVVAVWTAPLFPLLTMERKPLRTTVRRSIEIVRGSAWRMLAVLGVVWLAPQLVGNVVAAFLHGSPTVDAFAHVGVVIVFEPIAAAIIVAATFALVDLDAARRARAATR